MFAGQGGLECGKVVNLAVSALCIERDD